MMIDGVEMQQLQNVFNQTIFGDRRHDARAVIEIAKRKWLIAIIRRRNCCVVVGSTFVIINETRKRRKIYHTQ